MAGPTISIIIPTLDRRDLLESAVASIRQHPPRWEYEILVVDSGRNGSADWAREAGCEGIKLGLSESFARAVNYGLERCRGDVLILMNDDVTVDTGTLDRLWESTCPGRYPAVAGCRLRYPNGLVQHAGIGLDQQMNPYLLWQQAPHDHPEVLRPSWPVAVSFALVAISRSLWDHLGGLDESLVNAYEDLDFCLRVREVGYQISYLPEATAVHLEGQSPGRHDHDAESWGYFRQKWVESGRISGVTGVYPFSIQRGGGQ